MKNNIKDTLRELSEIYDKESNDSYVSLYLNKNTSDKFIDRRRKACESVLKNDELTNFQKTMDDIEQYISKITYKHIAVFASKKNNLLEHVTLNIDIDDLLIVDSSPYLRPLARIIDEWESFTLLLINTNKAKIFSVSLGEITDTKSVSADIMNKHKKGGWSQARFNRLRRGAIKDFYKDVIKALEKRSDEKIIIAGPGNAKIHFKEMLPQNLIEKLVDIIDIDFDDEKKLIDESINLLSKDEKKRSADAVVELKNEILKDGLAVYGIKETVKAVRNGQVELLIIEKDHKINGWICENCQAVEEGYKKTCPYCDSNTSKVDVIEEILEFAQRTDAEIEFTDSEEIADLGHIGAILRFK